MSSSNHNRKQNSRDRKKRRAARKRLIESRKSTNTKETVADRRIRRSKRENVRRERVAKIRAHARDPEGERLFLRWAFFIFLNVVVLCLLVQIVPEDWHPVLAIFGVPYGLLVLISLFFRLFIDHHDKVQKHKLICPKCGRSSIRPAFSRRRRHSPPDDPSICFACKNDILDD